VSDGIEARAATRLENLEPGVLREPAQRFLLEVEVVVLRRQQVPPLPREPRKERSDVAGRERDDSARA
jgi:hypothetical protein